MESIKNQAENGFKIVFIFEACNSWLAMLVKLVRSKGPLQAFDKWNPYKQDQRPTEMCLNVCGEEVFLSPVPLFLAIQNNVMQLIELGEDQVGEMEGGESKILFGTC